MATPSKDSVSKLTDAFREVLKSPKLGRFKAEGLQDLQDTEPTDVADVASEEPKEKGFKDNNEALEGSPKEGDVWPSEKPAEPEAESENVFTGDENWLMDVNQDVQNQRLDCENTDPAEFSGIPGLKIENIQAEVTWESDNETPDNSDLGNITEQLDKDNKDFHSETEITRASVDSEPFTDTLTMAVTMEAGAIEQMADHEQIVMNYHCQETGWDTALETADKVLRGKSTTECVDANKDAREVLKKEESKQELAVAGGQKHSLRQTCLRPVVVLEDILKVPAAVVEQRITAGKKSSKNQYPNCKGDETDHGDPDGCGHKAATVTVTLSVNEVEVLSDHGHVMMHIGCQETEASDVPAKDATDWNTSLEEGRDALKQKAKREKESRPKDQKREKEKSRCNTMPSESHVEDERSQKDGIQLKGKKTRKRVLSRQTISDESENVDMECVYSKEWKKATKKTMTPKTSDESCTLRKRGRKTRYAVSHEILSEISSSEDQGTKRGVLDKKETAHVSCKEIASEGSVDELKIETRQFLSRGSIPQDSDMEVHDMVKKGHKKSKCLSLLEVLPDSFNDERTLHRVGVKRESKCTSSQEASENEGWEDSALRKKHEEKPRHVSSLSEDPHLEQRLKGVASKRKRLQINQIASISNQDHQDLHVRQKSVDVLKVGTTSDERFLVETPHNTDEVQSAAEEEQSVKDAGHLDKDTKKDSVKLGEESWVDMPRRAKTEDGLTSKTKEIPLDTEALKTGTLHKVRREPKGERKTWTELAAKKALIPQKHWNPVLRLEDILKRDLDKVIRMTSPVSREIRVKDKSRRSSDSSSHDSNYMDIKVRRSGGHI